MPTKRVSMAWPSFIKMFCLDLPAKRHIGKWGVLAYPHTTPRWLRSKFPPQWNYSWDPISNSLGRSHSKLSLRLWWPWIQIQMVIQKRLEINGWNMKNRWCDGDSLPHSPRRSSRPTTSARCAPPTSTRHWDPERRTPDQTCGKDDHAS